MILWPNPVFCLDYDFVTVKTAKLELQIEQSRNRLTVTEVAFTYAYIQLPGFAFVVRSDGCVASASLLFF